MCPEVFKLLCLSFGTFYNFTHHNLRSRLLCAFLVSGPLTDKQAATSQPLTAPRSSSGSLNTVFQPFLQLLSGAYSGKCYTYRHRGAIIVVMNEIMMEMTRRDRPMMTRHVSAG